MPRMCWNPMMLLGMPGLSGMHTSYPVIVQTKEFLYVLRVNTLAESKFLMLFGTLSMGTAYLNFVPTNLRICV